MLETPPIQPENPKSPEKPLPLHGPLSGFDFLAGAIQPAFNGGPLTPPSGRVLMAWSWVASVIDALFVFALVCLFLSLSLFVEKAGLRGLPIERSLLLKTGALIFCFLHATYLLVLRIFLGNSFGEWACGLRLGVPRQRFSSKYSLLVLFRFAIVVGTGVIVLPILSLATGTDWAGRLSGLPLISVLPRRNNP